MEGLIMNTETTWSGVVKFFDTSLGIAIIWALLVGLVLFLYCKTKPSHEPWREYEDNIITGIKLAEKQVPGDVPDWGLVKLDTAFQFLWNAYAQTIHGKRPSATHTELMEQNIQNKHSESDQQNGLDKEIPDLQYDQGWFSFENCQRARSNVRMGIWGGTARFRQTCTYSHQKEKVSALGLSTPSDHIALLSRIG